MNIIKAILWKNLFCSRICKVIKQSYGYVRRDTKYHQVQRDQKDVCIKICFSALKINIWYYRICRNWFVFLIKTSLMKHTIQVDKHTITVQKNIGEECHGSWKHPSELKDRLCFSTNARKWGPLINLKHSIMGNLVQCAIME